MFSLQSAALIVFDGLLTTTDVVVILEGPLLVAVVFPHHCFGCYFRFHSVFYH